MTVNEIARNYNITIMQTFGTRRTYYLDDVYVFEGDANKRAAALKSNGFFARKVPVVKPFAKPRTVHFAVYHASRHANMVNK